MTGTDRLSLTCAGAALLAGIPLTALTRDRTFLMLAGLLILLSFGVGTLLRHRGTSEGLVRLGQLAPVLLVPLLAGGNLLAMAARTVSYVRTAVAPMAYDPGFAVFSAVLVWAVFIVTEELASGRGAARAFLPLVVPYAIPAIALSAETSMVLFLFVAVSYVMVLAASTAKDLEPARRSGRRGFATSAILVTALALTGTVIASAPVPERSALSQRSGGLDNTQVGDPSVDLIRNITSTSDAIVASYQTSDDKGVYLRLAALPVLDGAGFHPQEAVLVPLQFDQQTPQGLGRQQVRTSIKLGDLRSQYLPMPWLPLTTTVDPDKWRYDQRSLAVISIGSGGTSDATARLSYETTSIRLPDTDAILDATSSAEAPEDDGLTVALPSDLPTDIRELAYDVTDGVTGVGAKVSALLAYLHSARFTYSTAVSPGTTMGTLEDFLLGSRTGYCEQFAGAMAVMSRVLGIPSRVVVGFLPGKHVGDRWDVMARNMHAWTEVYLGADRGWVPVDATPGSAVANNPVSSASPSASPSRSSANPTPTSDTVSVKPTVAPLPNPTDTDGGTPGWLGWVAAVGAGVLLVGAGPRLLRAALRRYRLSGSADPVRTAERAWAEVRAVAVDQGARWPAGSTRQVAAALGPGLDSDAREQLVGLALVVERARYAPRPDNTDGLVASVRTITASLVDRGSVSVLDRWWPRSLRPRLRFWRARVAQTT